MKGRQQRARLSTVVAALRPDWSAAEVERAIRAGEIEVEARVVLNPAALVIAGTSVRHHPPAELAGWRKLRWAIDTFDVQANGMVVVDVGASTGGFTRAWLEAGAARVYAVDVGHGQLRGNLRQDPRVVNLERTNVGDLSPATIRETVDAVSVDVSYLSLSAAVAQLAAIELAPRSVLLGLVKPMFELRLATIPSDRPTLERARDTAIAGVSAAGWQVEGCEECPVRGRRGAVEYFLLATLRAH
jgi:23S rRNA (cytidine1920-2'-O)/16S rRNA (cytidine1409-2'-O)-methyltransferase